MRRIREAIDNNSTESFLRTFLEEQFPQKNIPDWIKNALQYMNYNIEWINNTRSS